MDSDNDGRGTDHAGDTSAHASKEQSGGGPPKGKTQIDASISKVVSTLEHRVTEFGKASKDIRLLTETVKRLSEEMNTLKRRQDENSQDGQTTSSKKARVDPSIQSEQEKEGEECNTSDDSDIEDFMNDEEEKTEEGTEEDEYDDLDDFFEPVVGVGEAVGERIAKITNKTLRGKKEDAEDKGEEKDEKKQGKDDDETKLKNLKKKHLRPKNIEYLQVPDVDSILFRQLKRDVRQTDFQLKKAHYGCSQALVPVIKAMEEMKRKDHKKASEYISDAFKILCLMIKANVAGRRERIKKELEPRFKSLGDHEASPTKLFGDNLQENIKKLEGTKTSLTISQKNFLGKKGGNRQQTQPQGRNRNHNQRSASQSHTNNNNRYDKKPFVKKRNNPQNRK